MNRSYFSPAAYLSLLLAVLLGSACRSATADEAALSGLVFSDGAHLEQQRAKFTAGDAAVVSLVEQLEAEADQLLNAAPYSVVHKAQTPPSGDKHDYMSQGPYWWPDTTKSNGLPYIRRDGEVNPERATLTDHREMGELMNASETLSHAYYYTGQEKYAQKAAELLEIWFLADSTRMNPHLEFGQAIPGRTEGRGIGIIETRYLGKITDAVALIRASDAWNPELESGMQEWMGDYLNWLLTSEKGKNESVHPNNHGTWYDVQAATLALFTGQDSLARSMLENAKESRMDEDLEANGAQPKELARTLSFNYSTMNLFGMFTLARIGEMVGVDLWHYDTPNGANLKKALDYLLPAALGQSEWPHKQIKPIKPEELIPHLGIASKVYDPAYAATAQQLLKQYPEKAGSALHWPM